MKSFYNRLSANHKRLLVIGGVIGAVVLGVTYSLPSDSERIKRNKRDEDVRAVLTSRDSRKVGMESLAAQQKNLEQRNKELEREIERIKRESTGTSGLFETITSLSTDLKEVRADLRRVSKENERLSEQIKKTPKQSAQKSKPSDSATAPIADEPTEIEKTLSARKEEVKARKKDTIEDIFGREPSQPAPVQATSAAAEATESQSASRDKDTPLIRTIVRESDAEDTAEDTETDDSLYLPVGSILTGVLINGMDAPTGRQARNEPFPATLRVQKEAILPNHFSADVRECFMQVSGYGDMSSERAYLRGEAISCVRDDGGIIEARLDSYAIGEDGKAGVRGRLVSKEGQLLARSLIAGFLEGVAGAFNVQAAPSLRIDGGDSIPIYKQTIDSDRIQGGFARGTGNALSRLADYYMDMAESIFPVIEVDAGRQVDVVIVRGTSLKVKSKAKL